MIYPGIDLGTTFSLIAHVNTHSQPALFPDAFDANQFRTPSVVLIGKEGTLVGQAAEELLEDAPNLPVARYIKSNLAKTDWRYIDHEQRNWRAEALSALILKKLLRDAEMFSNDKLGPAVITIPAQFTDEQRKATLYAAQLAGLEKVHLIEEPVAAATYYGLDEGGEDRTLMVYDFGGGTFDVTILQTSDKGLFVLATDGVANLGGRTINDAIVLQFIANNRKLREIAGISEASNQQRIHRIAEKAKLKLAQSDLAQFKQSIILAGEPVDLLLTRLQFDQICKEAVDQSIATCERCLNASDLSWSDMDRVMLTGGSSLLPIVAKTLLAVSKKSPSHLITRQPHQAVAYGAAILAQRLANSAEGASFIRQVTGYDLCLRVWDRQQKKTALEVLIPKNSPLPAKYSRLFYTNRDDQTRIVLEFVQRRTDAGVESSLGHFKFGPIKEPRMNYPVEVTASIGNDGLIHIEARDKISGTILSQHIDAEGKASDTLLNDEFDWVKTARINR